MKDTETEVTDEDWRILKDKIQAFHDHVNALQKDLKTTLKPSK